MKDIGKWFLRVDTFTFAGVITLLLETHFVWDRYRWVPSKFFLYYNVLYNGLLEFLTGLSQPGRITQHVHDLFLQRNANTCAYRVDLFFFANPCTQWTKFGRFASFVITSHSSLIYLLFDFFLQSSAVISLLLLCVISSIFEAISLRLLDFWTSAFFFN